MNLPERPIIPGFHPDPTICRVGENYYLACSSFEYAPGVPLFHSKDLVTWTQIGNILDRPTQLDVQQAGASGGIFAPTLRHHDGRYWMITTNHSTREGQLLVTAADPRGPWSDPVYIPGAVGIDPDLAWDGDGICYVTWSGLGPREHHGIQQAVLDPLTGELLSTPRTIWNGTGGKFPEAPHLYEVDGFWYLLIAEGGTERGHMASIARGPRPTGPFEADPSGPLVTARSTNSPVQNTGHADLVQRPDGSWAMVFLGTRPRGVTPEWHVLGRETFAADIEWSGAWPRLGDPIEPTNAPTACERLETNQLPVTWVAPERFPDTFVHCVESRWHVEHAGVARSFVGRRQEHTFVDFRARIDTSRGIGGIEIRIDENHAVRIERDGDRVYARARIGSLDVVLGNATSSETSLLRIITNAAGTDDMLSKRGPDEIIVQFIDDAGAHELGRIDGRYLSTEVAGGFTGRFVGLVCSSGTVAVTDVSYRGTDLAAGARSSIAAAAAL